MQNQITLTPYQFFWLRPYDERQSPTPNKVLAEHGKIAAGLYAGSATGALCMWLRSNQIKEFSETEKTATQKYKRKELINFLEKNKKILSLPNVMIFSAAVAALTSSALLCVNMWYKHKPKTPVEKKFEEDVFDALSKNKKNETHEFIDKCSSILGAGILGFLTLVASGVTCEYAGIKNVTNNPGKLLVGSFALGSLIFGAHKLADTCIYSKEQNAEKREYKKMAVKGLTAAVLIFPAVKLLCSNLFEKEKNIKQLGWKPTAILAGFIGVLAAGSHYYTRIKKNNVK